MSDARVTNPLIEQFRRGGVPKELRLMAAQAALPLKSDDLLELLTDLVRDPEAEVREAAQRTAAHGASLAEKAGFQSQSMAVEAAPTWKGILKTAEEHRASLIVLGSHRRSGLAGRLREGVRMT